MVIRSIRLAIAGTVRGLAEAVALARAHGLDSAAVLNALTAGSAHSRQLEQHQATLAAVNFDFARDFAWLAKDIELARASAALDLPMTRLIAALLADS